MGPRLRLDVLVPTHNRAPLLDRCIRSLLNATPSARLDTHITVICNGCRDDSRDVIRRLQAAFPGQLSMIAERRQGKSKALNAGIAATTGDLVGMIDDDEEVDAAWIQIIGEAFQEPSLDFIGGPYVPVSPVPPPDWLPDDYLAVLGGADNGSVVRPYNKDFPGILKGGNAVIRRAMLERVGPYAEHLGPGASARLFSCEDEDMYWRLLENGASGQYLPDLVIYHYISKSRLTQQYHRNWCFWRGVSRGLMDRHRPLPVPYLVGVPRFLWGRAAGAILRRAVGPRTRPERERFADELRMWDVAGYFYGKHIYTLARFSPIKSRRRGESAQFAAQQRCLAELDEVEHAG